MKCVTCTGRGKLVQERRHGHYGKSKVYLRTCSRCKGTGKLCAEFAKRYVQQVIDRLTPVSDAAVDDPLLQNYLMFALSSLFDAVRVISNENACSTGETQ